MLPVSLTPFLPIFSDFLFFQHKILLYSWEQIVSLGGCSKASQWEQGVLASPCDEQIQATFSNINFTSNMLQQYFHLFIASICLTPIFNFHLVLNSSEERIVVYWLLSNPNTIKHEHNPSFFRIWGVTFYLFVCYVLCLSFLTLF